jgi:hypothetical protein
MNLKQRLKNGEHLVGTMVTTFAAADMAKLLQQYGFDFSSSIASMARLPHAKSRT